MLNKMQSQYDIQVARQNRTIQHDLSLFARLARLQCVVASPDYPFENFYLQTFRLPWRVHHQRSKWYVRGFRVGLFENGVVDALHTFDKDFLTLGVIED